MRSPVRSTTVPAELTGRPPRGLHRSTRSPAPTHHTKRTPVAAPCHVGIAGSATAWGTVPDLVALRATDVTFTTAAIRCAHPARHRWVDDMRDMEATSWMT